MENNVGNVYGSYLPCKNEDVQKAKEALLEQMIDTIHELAKDDRFWIVNSIPGMTKDVPECVIPEAWIGCDVTVGWKIAIPQMEPPHRKIKIKIGDREYTREELKALPKAEFAAIIEQRNMCEEENIMNEICGDNRFEIIQRAKEDLLKATNIEGSQDEMAVLDSILFRAWQMGWLDMYEPDYKERMKKEYWQLKDRYNKLHKMCIKYEAGTLEFKPRCELELLKEQKAAMGNYLHCLEVRAQIEGIEL